MAGSNCPRKIFGVSCLGEISEGWECLGDCAGKNIWKNCPYEMSGVNLPVEEIRGGIVWGKCLECFQKEF